MVAKTTAGATAAASAMTVERRIELATAPAWLPMPGDKMTGTLATVRKQDGSEYGPYPVFVFDTVNGAVAVHAFHQTLLDGLKDIGAAKGQVYTLAYVGERVTNKTKTLDVKDQTTYHLYVVMSGDGTEDMPADDYDWTSDESLTRTP